MKENIEEDLKKTENLIECFRKAEIVNLECKESMYQRCNYSHYKAIEHILSDYKRVLKENEELKDKWDKDTHKLQNDLDIANAKIIELKEELFMLKAKTKRQKIKDLECHCGECDDEIYRICEKYCNYQDDEVALCERERFANMDIEDYEKIEKTLRIEKKMEDLIEKLQKENEELNEYITLAPNLDEMTAVKYINIQKEAYIKGRAEEQQKAEQIICEQYISKQKIKDKIEELEKKRIKMEKDDIGVGFTLGREWSDLKSKIEAYEDLVEEKGE